MKNQNKSTKLENAMIFANLLTLLGVILLIISYVLPAKAIMNLEFNTDYSQQLLIVDA